MKQNLDKVLAENPDPSKWSKWLKVLIKILVVIASAIGGDYSNIINLLNF